jgi:transcriptional regulator with XRE-family HTH domain
MVDYSERLKAAMQARAVKPRELADVLRVSYQAIEKALDGRTKALSAPNNTYAARFLGVSSDWLATGEGQRERDAPPEAALTWPFGDYAPYESLSRGKKAQLAQIVSAFLAGAEPEMLEKRA